MNTPTHEEIARRAQKLWQDYGSPAGRDPEIWLEAERQLMAGSTESASASASSGTSRITDKPESTKALAERIKGDTASESAAEYHISPPIPDEDAVKAALQKKEARAPKVPVKTAPKAPPPESGKPLWSKPHSS